ncbi:16S rRNA (adenine(1518)-N(6)/adenine(1519)-N(6))-dimethyltransferase RsmA [Streptobacillus moniliformis]|uniref:Ribosomal RNA small subunit methyltransferase A n=1 Tax=Streptobacillus moniliformis (strain ATCC 14647 / DSM 12112 / NCTC 10651 / 9901) TaxID=519441 RepID=D1AXG7_STRM9|nr:16S rRNA (adenine(1518)-N(6)/adenine(1519)-N(6))-dimethyltransferase RsmA [Streptobacillus moniliformis]ACZ00993.1 dimethyladenosine transferase [Streptobacillus moniliformis DSM 12112]AVL42631.1 ribosomal RNA small subunit methyltransferase A [Streptobacillus moniliformis]SQA13868.1 Ribosomal RNA small subunit methyltransferase A [Streptobacillus moniliformis]
MKKKKNNVEHKHKKKFGQNFLDDKILLEKIKEVTNISVNDNIIEIGPGIGFLTSMILESGAKLKSFEIDNDLIPVLNKKFGNYENFELIHVDFLLYNLENIMGKGKEYRVIANIPYYITAPIINKLLEFKDNIKDIYLMVQKEVGERLNFEKNTSNKGVFTHVVGFHSKVEYLFTVEKEFFDPIPKVDSAFIRINIDKEEKYSKMISFEKYLKYVKASFASKRKSISNNLKTIGISKGITENALVFIGKNNNSRAEELSIEDFIALINIIEKG